ncbi:MSHA fimbrial ATPase MshE [Aeromonas veronii]|uniref:MSHA biogenesis protein MshE n=1 Tax=Aeromonas veronii TaxID=654 RepID=A0AAC9FM17_AERVE|nr:MULTISPECIES: MSHA fimbrial ATPase MshE [Aeromonas]ANB53086.1 MSHA biogenesis protein MshE [Aeromonas veronii]MBJ7583725.1 MSHA fimbrial ATPase MshE [Aeromonas veronii]MBL0631057.1 MSHA fimbrial ATPase MshE [Aeromonas veronii]MEB5669813.1 MSHA fimbrial ATPase MshE [Aeromonas veronii]QET80747.1 MSHA biogenesis protein MshE [Aeromonas veronii]
MAQPRLKMRLGDLLVQEQIISDDQLQLALQQQRQTGRKLGTTLIDLGFISEVQLLQFLARQLDVPFFDLNNLTIDAAAVPLLPEVQARRYRALAVNLTDDKVTVAMSDPADLSALDAIAALLSPRIMVLAVAREGQLLEYFDRLYRRTREIESFAEQLQEEYQDSGFELGSSNLGANDEGEATVAKLLRSLFEDAVQVGASDIHIEPDEKVLRIRQRIDGILHENILNEVRIAQALVLRLKLVAGLDISEKRLPQDGRFNMKVRGRDVDVRMSTMPVQYGESVVMRLLDQSSGILSLTETGMPPEILTRFRRQLKRPHGMILVTGPTGSGKTTTLYGALSELNQSSNKIITVEDPVEYRLSRVNQVQVNPKIGLTFSNVLRSTLRQDPDILLVGEMRDNETVEIGLRGAITGHLVLTTLHTNDAVTSALRLIDMGAPGYLVASALRAVVAQRLVRRVCEHCVEEKALDEGQATWLTVLSGEAPGQHTYHKGRGCQSCNFTGYSGRIGVYELLELDQPMMDALRRNDAEGFAKAARQHEHYRPLALTALDYARQGITSVDEVLRLAEDLG